MERQDADALLEGFLRRIGVPIEDYDRMMPFLSCCDYFLFQITIDKAGVNFTVCSWTDYVIATWGPVGGLHVELCACHGTATAKTRSGTATKLATAVNSFSRAMRESSFVTALEDAVFNEVKSRVEPRFQKRPQEFVDRANELFKQVVHTLDDDYIRGAVDGRRQCQFLADLEELLAVIDTGDANDAVGPH